MPDSDQSATGPGIAVLVRRAEFLRVRSAGRKAAAPGLVVQAWTRVPGGGNGASRNDDPVAGLKLKFLLRPAGGQDQPPVRIGLTASKKVGNAVARNRARRRLRAIAREMVPAHVLPGTDLVLIARSETVTQSWADLRRDFLRCLKKTGVYRAGAP